VRPLCLPACLPACLRRESEDDAVADAVFDQTRSDKGYEETSGQGQQTFDGTFARKPQ
jgi:hypothetical protein